MLLVTTRWQHSITYWAMLVQVGRPGCRGSQGLWDSGEPGWNTAWLALHVPDRFPTPGTPWLEGVVVAPLRSQSQARIKCFSLLTILSDTGRPLLQSSR